LLLKPIKLSAVSYLNTLPFIYGMEQNPEFLKQIELQKDIPSKCAEKLIKDKVDLGLVPVAIIPKMNQAHILSDYCIGAVGKVKSVLLFSEVPLQEIETIVLDYQSKTSVQLCRLLVKNYWKIDVSYEEGQTGYELKVGGNKAALIIGDRTFNLKKKYPYQYDLAEAWFEWQKLPFVFAAWVSNKPLSNDFIRRFNSILKFGVNRTKEAVTNYKLNQIEPEEQLDYLNNYISYELDSAKRDGLKKFHELLKSI